MDARDMALMAAGVIGVVVAVVHGVILQRYMVRRATAAFTDERQAALRRLTAPLLHFSTYNWLLGGVALIAARWFDPGARLATGLLVGSSYLAGALGNLWASRGRHPGWALYALAVVLIGFGVA